jgi:hypothetical protein
MKYQLIEKEIYSEADLLHFGDKYEMGEIVNEYFPDYSGVPIGDAIFESEDPGTVEAHKEQLEIKRLKTLNEAIPAFFEDDELADEFYASENFAQLKELYQNEFKLKLIRTTANKMGVDNREFYFPPEANDQQMKQIQKLLGLYFFEIMREH